MCKFHLFLDKKSRVISLLTLSILLLFSLFSCDSATKAKTGSLSGNIVLVNDTDDPAFDLIDFSGVTVALYNLAILDTTLSRINREYPHIGVQISQETEFDHRLQSPVAIVRTDESGSFDFTKVPLGDYNIVFVKESWGNRTVYNHSITQDNYKTLDVVYMYPVVELSGTIQEEFCFESLRTYEMSEDTLFLGNVNVQPDATIIVRENKRLSFAGEINQDFESGYWKVTSASSYFDTHKAPHIYEYDMLNFSYSNIDVAVQRLILEYSTNGIKSNSSNFTLNNSILRKCSSSVASLSAEHSNVSNIILYDTSLKGIVANFEIYLDKSVFANNRESIMLHECEGTVQNSYFYGSYIGIRTFLKQIEIIHNCFDKNDVAVAPSAASPSIHENNFYDNKRDVEMNRGGVATDPGYCDPEITHNNFMGNGFYIHLRGSNSTYAEGYIPFIGVNQDQHYPNNYLKQDDVTKHIYDANYPNSTINFTVSMLPRLSRKINSAGIKEE